MHFRYSLLISSLIFLSLNAFAQGGLSSGVGSSASGGEASSSLYDVNYFTGTATVNIPIYEYYVDGYNFGYSLTYNTKGLKVDNQPSGLGVGWNLMGNYNVYRVVKDIPDEMVLDSDGYGLYNYTMGGVDEWRTTNSFTKYVGKFYYNQDPLKSANPLTYKKDSEHDDWYLSVPGMSFTYHIGIDGYVYTDPQADVIIEYYYDGVKVNNFHNLLTSHTSTEGKLFTISILDDRGYRYTLIPTEYIDRYDEMDPFNIEVGTGNRLYEIYNQVYQWSVSKIEFPNGNVIHYNYSPEFEIKINNLSNFHKYDYFLELNHLLAPVGAAIESASPSKAVYYKKLESVSYPNGITLSLQYERRIDDIERYFINGFKVADRTDTIRYVLDHYYTYTTPNKTGGYFINTKSDLADSTTFLSRKARLQLNNIYKYSNDSALTTLLYSFVYDEMRLPERGSVAQDWLGYFNGQTTTGSGNLIPDNNNPATSKRRQVFNNMRAGALSYIYTGVGGSVRFQYDSHHAVHQDNTLVPADNMFYGKEAYDGLRLYSITEKDLQSGSKNVDPNRDNVLKHTFEYFDGQFFINGGYYHNPKYLKADSSGFLEYTQFSEPVSSGQTIQNSNLGYSRVKITTTGNREQLLSVKDIEFTNFKGDDGKVRYFVPHGEQHYYQFPYVDKPYLKSWEIGLPKRVQEFDSKNLLVKELIHTYAFHLDSLSAKGKINNIYEYFIKKDPIYDPVKMEYISRYYTSSYTPFRGKVKLMSTVDRNYVSNTVFTSDTTFYAYNSNDDLVSMSVRNSLGKNIRESYVYNTDLSSTIVNSKSALLYMKNRNMKMKVYSDIQQEEGLNPLLLGAEIPWYELSLDRLVKKTTLTTKLNNPLSYSSYIGTSAISAKVNSVYGGVAPTWFHKDAEYSLYDKFTNPTEVKHIATGTLSAVIYDELTKTPVATANAAYKDIAYTSFEEFDIKYSLNPGDYTQFGNFFILYNSIIAGSRDEAVTGHHIYKLITSGGVPQFLNSVHLLPAGKEFVLSFWSKGTKPVVKIGSTSLTLPAPLYTVNSWNHYVLKFTPAAAAQLAINAPATGTSYIDEVRLYPSQANMTSSVSHPIFGSLSATDIKGRITHFYYDGLGRPTLVRDNRKQIVNKNEYSK